MVPDPLLVWTARVGLALVFGAAALHKWRAPESFASALRGHALTPAALVAPLAVAFPSVEAAVAVGLVLPGFASLAEWSGAALLALYTTAIAVNLARGRRDIDCGCTLHPRPLSGGLVARNVLLAFAATLAAATPAMRALGALDLFAGAACVAALSLLWLAVDALGGLPARAFAGRPT
jgi:hypothetical protein